MVSIFGKLFGREPDYQTLTAVITEAEKGHIGEIAVYLRERPAFFSKKTTREEALDQFSMRRIWDTEENVGVLVFVCLRKKAIEIVADRGASKRITLDTWNAICSEAAEIFRNEKDPLVGIEHAIKRVGAELRKVFSGERVSNQLPDTVIAGKA